MRKTVVVTLLVSAHTLTSPAEAAQKRSQAVGREFQLSHPCPSTGKTKGRCPGFQKDHRIPLCFYGPDEVWNLQWLSVAAHREKTKLDIKVCDWDGIRGIVRQ